MKPSIDGLKAKYGENYGIKTAEERADLAARRESLRPVVNKFFHGDVTETYVSPALLAAERERASMSVVPGGVRSDDAETASLGQRAAAIVREKAGVHADSR